MKHLFRYKTVFFGLEIIRPDGKLNRLSKRFRIILD